MIKLSDRLELIANLIKNNETMADIGTDHGFLPLALWERGICKKIIFSDVNSGPLEKAKENIEGIQTSFDFDIRFGNGLETILAGEVSAIVIAGMGGVLMTEILAKDLNKSKSFEKIILQPRNGQSKLRYWLKKNGFEISTEALVREGRYICEIMVVEPMENMVEMDVDWLEVQYELPEVRLIKGNPLIKEFIDNKIRIENQIINRILKGGNENAAIYKKKIESSEVRLKFMKEYRREVE